MEGRCQRPIPAHSCRSVGARHSVGYKQHTLRINNGAARGFAWQETRTRNEQLG